MDFDTKNPNLGYPSQIFCVCVEKFNFEGNIQHKEKLLGIRNFAYFMPQCSNKRKIWKGF